MLQAEAEAEPEEIKFKLIKSAKHDRNSVMLFFYPVSRESFLQGFGEAVNNSNPVVCQTFRFKEMLKLWCNISNTMYPGKPTFVLIAIFFVVSCIGTDYQDDPMYSRVKTSSMDLDLEQEYSIN